LLAMAVLPTTISSQQDKAGPLFQGLKQRAQPNHDLEIPEQLVRHDDGWNGDVLKA
jgi:hypothetical protein